MKQADDKKTMELPGMPTPRRRGRPPKHDFGPMTNAERQKAYRRRAKEKLFVTDYEKLTKVALLGQLGQALSVLDNDQASDIEHEAAGFTASKIVAEVATRYQLRPV